VRVFKGRDSTGVRGVNLAEGDSVIGMAVLRHVDVTTEEVGAYFKWDVASRGDIEASEDDEAPGGEADVPFERLAWLKTQEQFILTVTSNGLGKRASAYEYRVTNRGGKGLKAHKLTGDARLIASFPVKDEEELLLVTDKGQLIRTGVAGVRIAGRATQGVILINVGEDEHVVAAERLEALGGEAGDNAEGDAGETGEGEAK
jgi:DNA gyrase subunit A